MTVLLFLHAADRSNSSQGSIISLLTQPAQSSWGVNIEAEAPSIERDDAGRLVQPRSTEQPTERLI
jgi:hypothetical protein